MKAYKVKIALVDEHRSEIIEDIFTTKSTQISYFLSALGEYLKNTLSSYADTYAEIISIKETKPPIEL